MADRKRGRIIAAASSDGTAVDLHFGRAERFFIFEVPADGAAPVFLGTKDVSRLCAGGHDAERLRIIAETLSGCEYVFSARIGEWAADALAEKGIRAMELPGSIAEAAERLRGYLELEDFFAGLTEENE